MVLGVTLIVSIIAINFLVNVAPSMTANAITGVTAWLQGAARASLRVMVADDPSTFMAITMSLHSRAQDLARLAPHTNNIHVRTAVGDRDVVVPTFAAGWQKVTMTSDVRVRAVEDERRGVLVGWDVTAPTIVRATVWLDWVRCRYPNGDAPEPRR